MDRKQKRTIVWGVVVLIIIAAILAPFLIEAWKIRGKVLVRDAKTKQPIPGVTVLFEVSRTLTQIYPPTRAGHILARKTDEQGLVQIPDVSGPDWADATHLRICVLSDGYRKYLVEFSRSRFGKNGSNCRAVKLKLEPINTPKLIHVTTSPDDWEEE